MSDKKISILNYLKIDLYRCIFSWKFLISCMFISLSLLLGCSDSNGFSNIVYGLEIIFYSISLLLTFIFASFAYADCFCEDFENNYIRYELIRGNLKKYVLSKVIVITISCILTMIIGILVFAIILNCFLPWFDPKDDIYLSLMNNTRFSLLLKNNCFILYFATRGFQIGLLASILSLIASYISLYISNKLLLLTIPSMTYYFLNNILSLFHICLYDIFIFPKILFKNTTVSFLIVLIVTIISIIILYFTIFKKIERRMQNG